MSTRWPIPLVPCALLAASVPVAAPAATAIRLQTTGELPFTAEELEQAAGARLAMSAETGAAVVIVEPADKGGVQLRIGERRAVVRVGERVGLAAARIVALAIAELAAGTTESAVAPQPEPSRPAAATRAEAAPLPAVAPPRHPVRISIALGGSKGLDATEPLTWVCEADATVPLPRFDLVGTLGIWAVPTRNPGERDEASFVAGVVRAGAGWRSGPLQLQLGPFVAPYRLEGGVSHTGVLAGGGATLRVAWRLAAAPKVTVFGSLRVDAFANRVSVSLIGAEPSFATPRVAAGVGIGIGWDLGS
jgi:hypothetical protein